MNIALIIAGGSSQRMGQDVPKQFICVDNKPIIIYTLEVFQRNSNIDSIVIVCKDGWQSVVEAYSRQFGITKVDNIISNGATRHDSIYNGLVSLKNVAKNDDIVAIMDANRPLVTDQVIDDSINKCKIYGIALPVVPCVDSMYFSNDGVDCVNNAKRESLFKGQSPESIKYGKAMDLYCKANDLKINNLSTAALLVEFGEKIYFSKGSERNIKITTTEDIEIFKALLASRKDEWLK